jgi:hypothetical protein
MKIAIEKVKKSRRNLTMTGILTEFPRCSRQFCQNHHQKDHLRMGDGAETVKRVIFNYF